MDEEGNLNLEFDSGSYHDPSKVLWSGRGVSGFFGAIPPERVRHARKLCRAAVLSDQIEALLDRTFCGDTSDEPALRQSAATD